jgi:PEGA domain
VKRLLVVALVACAQPKSVNGVREGQAVVVVTSNVSDAQIWVDGRYIGPLALVHAGLALDPGHHRIELRRDDYFSRYADLAVTRAERKTLELEMKPQLP